MFIGHFKSRATVFFAMSILSTVTFSFSTECPTCMSISKLSTIVGNVCADYCNNSDITTATCSLTNCSCSEGAALGGCQSGDYSGTATISCVCANGRNTTQTSQESW